MSLTATMTMTKTEIRAAHRADARDEKRALERAVQTFKSVSFPARLQVLLYLDGAPAPVPIATIQEVLGLSRPAVVHHVTLLLYGKLVAATRRGRTRSYALTATGRALVALVGQVVA